VNPFQELSHKVYFNDEKKNQEYHPCSYSNKVSTGKYTSFTFIPKSLYLQFLRVANIYFLIIAVLSSISEISPVSPITSVIPLVFVLGTSMIREALEDWVSSSNISFL